jgi:hypothetical protein
MLLKDVPSLCNIWKMSNWPKIVNAISTKIIIAIFSLNLPFAPICFNLMIPKHVLGPCYACLEHVMSIMGI